MIPRKIAQFGRRVFPHGLWEGPADRPWVALTIDDGPHPDITPRLLEALCRTRAPAAFFVEGDRAEAQPELTRAIHEAGHAVGNHTWNHRALLLGACLSPDRQVRRTEELLTRLCPGSPRIFRPPFGAIGPGGPPALSRHGLVPVYWSVLTGDWNPTSPVEVERRVLSALHPGAVVVLHGGRSWQSGTADALEGLVEAIRARGYEIVPLGRMLASAGLTPGHR